MADNTQINPGAGGDTIRTIDRTLSDPAATSSQKTQIVQLDAGGESQESQVSALNPLPVVPQGAEMRAQTMLLMQTLLLAQTQPQNGFVPQEIPSFLGGF